MLKYSIVTLLFNKKDSHRFLPDFSQEHLVCSHNREDIENNNYVIL